MDNSSCSTASSEPSPSSLSPRRVWGGVAFLYLTAVACSLVQFRLWNQVVHLDAAHQPFSLEALLLLKNTMRYYLVMPVFKIRDATGLNVDWIYSQFVAVMILGIGYFVTRLVIISIQAEELFWYFLLLNTCIFIEISLFMNGRLVLAFLGISLLHYTLDRWIRRDIHPASFVVLLFVGWYFCCVSSGIMLVATLTVCTWLVVFIFRGFGNSPLSLSEIAMSLLILLSIYFIYPVLAVEVLKEIMYYGGNLIHMLDHGLGEYILKLGMFGIILLIFLSLAFLYFVSFVWKKYSEYRLFLIIISYSLALGLFGYATMLTGLPAVIVLTNKGIVENPSCFSKRFT